MFNLPNDVLYILRRLEDAGYRGDVVGGSVRDLLLGRSPDDFDITTSATPEEIKAVFSDLRTLDTGIKHGTVGILLDGFVYETTTYRVDGEYLDSRHPESVSFTRNIEEDLARRDFTVNAISYSPTHGLCDPFGGRSDLEKGIIRAVGEPSLRFREDALRILRGLRFAATFGFEIEERTSLALRECAHLLTNVSAERIWVELRKTIAQPYAYGILREYSDVFLRVMPGIDSLVLPPEDAFDSADPLSRLLLLFVGSGEGGFDLFCRGLKTDNHLRLLGTAILRSVGKYDPFDRISLTKALRDLGEEATRGVINLEIALGRATTESKKLLDDLISEGVCYRISDLDLTGSDVMSLGISGREVGIALDHLLTAVIEGRVENTKTELLKFLAKE